MGFRMQARTEMSLRKSNMLTAECSWGKYVNLVGAMVCGVLAVAAFYRGHTEMAVAAVLATLALGGNSFAWWQHQTTLDL